jgi:hypothetical protein
LSKRKTDVPQIGVKDARALVDCAKATADEPNRPAKTSTNAIDLVRMRTPLSTARARSMLLPGCPGHDGMNFNAAQSPPARGERHRGGDSGATTHHARRDHPSS